MNFVFILINFQFDLIFIGFVEKRKLKPCYTVVAKKCFYIESKICMLKNEQTNKIRK